MLVLGRRKGEKILIGTNLSVTLLSTRPRAIVIEITMEGRFPYRKVLREEEDHVIIPEVTIQLLRIRRGQARLGIIAPCHILILREEIQDHADNQLKPELGGEAGGA